MSEIALKQCPFCGGKAKMCNTNLGFFVECSNLGHIHNAGVLGGTFCLTEQLAAADWNGRAVKKKTARTAER